METILKFNSDNDGDTELAERATLATELCATLYHINGFLRNKLKYINEFKTAEEALEAVQQELIDTMIDKGINLDKIYT